MQTKIRFLEYKDVILGELGFLGWDFSVDCDSATQSVRIEQVV